MVSLLSRVGGEHRPVEPEIKGTNQLKKLDSLLGSSKKRVVRVLFRSNEIQKP